MGILYIPNPNSTKRCYFYVIDVFSYHVMIVIFVTAQINKKLDPFRLTVLLHFINSVKNVSLTKGKYIFNQKKTSNKAIHFS